MSEAYSDHRVYAFGDFTLDVDRASLSRSGKELSLRPRSFDVLRYLVDRQGKIVSRDELHDAIWGTAVVTDDTVTHCLIDIRKALADSSQSIIRTVPRRGYVFELPVTRPADQADTSLPVARAAYLRWGAAALVIATLGLLAFWIAPAPDRPSVPETEAAVDAASQPAVAVLPFSVLSDDQSQTHFADGLSEEILNRLARQRGLKVIARTSSFSFRGSNVDIATVADELGVSHVLEGSFRSDGDQIRVSVQLVDADTGEYLWTRSFDRELSASGIFDIQDEIAMAVSESLKLELPMLAHREAARMPTDNLEALEAYYEGRAKIETRLPEQLDEAAVLFEKVIDLDPGFALAHAALAYTSVLRSLHATFPLNDAFERMKVAIDAALAIDDQIGEIYLPQGIYLWWRYGDMAGSERAFLRGIELSPNYPDLYQWYAELIGFGLDRPHDAIPYSQKSVALDPRSAVIGADHARMLARVGRVEQAFKQIDRVIATNRSLALGYTVKGTLLRDYRGDLAGAISLFDEAHQKAPKSRLILDYLVSAHIDLGDFERAEAFLDAAALLAPRPVFSLDRATIDILQGDRARAVESASAYVGFSQGEPSVTAILRDHYMLDNDHDKALELYRFFYAPLFDDSSESVVLDGWLYQAAIELTVLLHEMGRLELAEKLLDATFVEAERRTRQGIGPPNIALARIHALRGDSNGAIDALREAIDGGWRAGWRLALYHDAALDGPRSMPEFQDIVAFVEADMAGQWRELEARVQR